MGKGQKWSLYISGKKDEPLNYRPVSLTNIQYKLCEKAIKIKWLKLQDNIIMEKQYGFRQDGHV